MNEARRFIRYVLPGTLFAVQFSIVFALLRPDLARKYLWELHDDAGLGFVLAGLFASGGLGFLFSAIHHTLHWGGQSRPLNHVRFLERLVTDRKIEFLTPAQLSREQAWMAVTTLWHERREHNDFIKSADRHEELIDHVHAVGTARVAVVAASLFGFVIAAAASSYELTPKNAFLFILAVGVSFAAWWLFRRSYHRTAQFAQGVIEGILYDALALEVKEKNKDSPIQIAWVPQFSPPIVSSGARFYVIAGLTITLLAVLSVGPWFSDGVTSMPKASADGKHLAHITRIRGTNTVFLLTVDGSHVFRSEGFGTIASDFREQLIWDTNSQKVVFVVAGERIFGYHAGQRRSMTNGESFSVLPLDTLRAPK